MQRRGMIGAAVLLMGLCCGCSVTVKRAENTPTTSAHLAVTTLTISGVGLGLPQGLESDRQMIALFEKQSGIRVQVVRDGRSNVAEYDEYLSLLDAAASLPDLLLMPALPTVSAKNLLLSLDSFLNADPDYQKVPASLRQSATGELGSFAAVCRYGLEGYFLNPAVFSAAKVAPLASEFSFSAFCDTVTRLSKADRGVPLAQFDQMVFWYPATCSSGVTWGIWNEGKLDPTGRALKTAVFEASRLRERCFSSADPPDSAEAVSDLWQSGALALCYGNTRQGSILSAVPDATFIGIAGDRPLLNADYIGITTACRDRKEAFALLKWLSYSDEGLDTRYLEQDFAKSGCPPLNGDPKLKKRFLDRYPQEGIRQLLSQVERGLVVGEDYILDAPIYLDQLTYPIQAISDQPKTIREWLAASVAGEADYETVASQLDRFLDGAEES